MKKEYIVLKVCTGSTRILGSMIIRVPEKLNGAAYYNVILAKDPEYFISTGYFWQSEISLSVITEGDLSVYKPEKI